MSSAATESSGRKMKPVSGLEGAGIISFVLQNLLANKR
jgi:hypothetical protein